MFSRTVQTFYSPAQPTQTVGQVTPPKANVVQNVSPAMEAQKVSPVVAAGQQMALAEPATPDAQKDPIKTATQQPGFWDQLLDASRTAGRNIFELMGDFASGYSHQQSSPTQQRLDREQQLRLQGNSQQAAKDLQSMEEGFQGKQQQADRDLQDKIATASASLAGLDIKRQQLQQEHDQFIQNLSLEKMRVQNEYMINMFNAQWQRPSMDAYQPQPWFAVLWIHGDKMSDIWKQFGSDYDSVNQNLGGAADWIKGVASSSKIQPSQQTQPQAQPQQQPIPQANPKIALAQLFECLSCFTWDLFLGL